MLLKVPHWNTGISALYDTMYMFMLPSFLLFVCPTTMHKFIVFLPI
jgi:hypothetical protein